MTAHVSPTTTAHPGTPAAVILRAFQLTAYAEGGLLPAILLVAVMHWVTGYGAPIVAVVGAAHGAAHGAAFTAYVLLVPAVARLLRWPLNTTSVAFSVAFVPFAPWAFERRIRTDVTGRSQSWSTHNSNNTGQLPLGHQMTTKSDEVTTGQPQRP
jgi:integral membrane protein